MSLSRQRLQRVMCYTSFAFKENERGHRRQALQQNPESGQRLRSLFPPQTFAIDCRPKKGPLSRKKTRWLLWLEDTSNGRVSPCSSSSSNPIAMLTTLQGANGTAASICASTTSIDKENFDYRNS